MDWMDCPQPHSGNNCRADPFPAAHRHQLRHIPPGRTIHRLPTQARNRCPGSTAVQEPETHTPAAASHIPVTTGRMHCRYCQRGSNCKAYGSIIRSHHIPRTQIRHHTNRHGDMQGHGRHPVPYGSHRCMCRAFWSSIRIQGTGGMAYPQSLFPGIKHRYSLTRRRHVTCNGKERDTRCLCLTRPYT